MKFNKIYTGLLIAFLFSAVGCQESFLDYTPTDSLTSETYYTTEEDFLIAVNGVYGINCTWRQMMEFVPMIDMATPAAVFGGSRFGQWHWGNSGFTPSDASGGAIWNFWRKWWLGIARANEVLYRIDQVSDDIFSSTEYKNQLKGEALFLRAFYYFQLTYSWRDLPLLTEPTSKDSYYPEKSDQQLIIKQIIADLTEASSLLPSVKKFRGTEDLGRATQGAALALLGKTYCFQEDWGNATTTLKKLIDTKDYDLTPGATGFNDQFWSAGENGIESIFEIQYTSGNGDQYGNAFVTYCAPGGVGIDDAGAGYGYIQPTDWMLDKFETVNGYKVASHYVSTNTDGSMNFTYSSDDPSFDASLPFDNRDPRLKWTIMYEGSPYLDEKFPNNSFVPSAPKESNFSTVKYLVHQASFASSEMNLVVLRYADVLLLYAEALMEQNKLGDAATYVDMVRSRTSVNMPGVPDDVIASQSALREYIHNERIRELAFEYGHLFFDLRRWRDESGNNLWLSEMQKYWTANKLGHDNSAIDIDEHNITWPLPQSEIELNPNLEQNEGY